MLLLLNNNLRCIINIERVRILFQSEKPFDVISVIINVVFKYEILVMFHRYIIKDLPDNLLFENLSIEV